jgi:glycosyltransferase involved in cell wall biosynthesis
MKPFASFCFSTFKRPHFLKATLESILLQKFSDYEVIVSDNDVEQSGRDIVEAFNDTRFKYFANEENLGMKRSFNKSLDRSTGSFIIMIADDDPVYPDMLGTLFELHQKFPGYGMYLGGCDWFCKSQSVGKMYGFKVGTNSCLSNEHDIDYCKAFSPNEFLKELFSFGIFPHYLWSTAIVKRDILQLAGGVPEYGTPFLGDYAYMATVGAYSGCVIINRSLGCQTLHDENFGRNQNEQIVVAAKNFPAFIESKASHLDDWQTIKEKMLRFTALWIISHLSFLNNYYRILNLDRTSIKHAEKQVFKIGYVKQFRLKYTLKKNFPSIHNYLVRLKKAINF